MTLGITNTTVPSRVGPGYTINVATSLVGPIANDDWFIVEVFPAAGGNYFCAGDRIAEGQHSVSVIMGEAKKISQGTLEQYIAPAANVQLVVYLVHNNFALADTTLTSPNWIWDPTGGLYRLAADALSGTGGTATLDAILSSVKTTFPRTS